MGHFSSLLCDVEHGLNTRAPRYFACPIGTEDERAAISMTRGGKPPPEPTISSVISKQHLTKFQTRCERVKFRLSTGINHSCGARAILNGFGINQGEAKARRRIYPISGHLIQDLP